MAIATVDMIRKYSIARPPTLPTLAALRTDPTPITMVQKMIGAMIILIRLKNVVPSTASDLPTSGASQPTRMPATTADQRRPCTGSAFCRAFCVPAPAALRGCARFLMSDIGVLLVGFVT